ncbi:MAG: hypothetical protein IJT75_08800 [Bacteroidaceae bacterium]|nr:hypothetical protein [Bacteroidaceae bacterium]
MKQKLLIMVLAIAAVGGGAWAQTRPASEEENGGGASLLWPVKGQQTGDNILLRPQDLLDHEANFCTLVIGAPEGTEVIAPADGEVSGIYLTYMSNLVTSRTYGYDDAKTFDAMRQKLDTDPDVRDPKKFINGSITLKLDDGRSIHIEGLRGDTPWRSGQRVTAGTVLGTVSYVFQKIGQPHIAVSFSKGKGAIDPMSPFGLQTTFKEPQPFTPTAKLTREQANEDFDVFIQSIRECYPSLRDIITPEQEEAFVREGKTRLDSAEVHFTTLFDLIGDAFTAKFLHDSHAWLQSSNPFFNARTDVQYPAVMLCTLGERMFVRCVQPGYEAHVGKEVATINGITAKKQAAYVRSRTNLFDAQVESTGAIQMLVNWWMQYQGTFWDAPVKLTFTDGTSVESPFLKPSQVKRYVPQPTAPTAYYVHQRQNRREDWSFRLIEDSIALLTLAHFHLNDVQMETIEDSIRSHAHVPYLIIDVRDNPGGDAGCEERLVKLFLKDEPSNFGYQKVMSNTTYPCFAHCYNWTADMRPFEDFVMVEGMEGYYNRRSLTPDKPTPNSLTSDPSPKERGVYTSENKELADSKGNHAPLLGRGGGGEAAGGEAVSLYVLTNENSASAATDFPAHLVRAGRAKTIGRETATAYHYMTALKFARFFLPNSHIEYQLPLVKAVTATNVSERFPYGRGLLPDYEVPLTREEIFSSAEDVILKRALEIIHEE